MDNKGRKCCEIQDKHINLGSSSFMKIKNGDILEVCCFNHTERRLIVVSVQEDTTCSTIYLDNDCRLDQIHENYSGHKQQPENFTLKNCNGEILSIDARVKIIKTGNMAG